MSAPPSRPTDRPDGRPDSQPSVWDERRWHYRRSLASRVTLLTTIVVGLSVAAVAAAAFVTVRMQMQQSLDESMLNRAHKAAEGGALAEISMTLPSWMLGAADVRVAVITADKQARSMDRDGPPIELGVEELEVAEGEREQSIRTITAEGDRFRVVTVPAGDSEALVLAQSLESQDRVLGRLGLVMGLFGIAGVLAAALAGWIVARNGLRPVRRLTTSVEEIARTEDLRPLRVEGVDEVARLATAFNQMLAALAASRDRQRRLVADAGHELRTPLTSLRTNLDLLTQADADPRVAAGLSAEARGELLADVRAQIEELTTLIGDLVELARDEPMPSAVDTVDLAEVVERAVGRVRRRAPTIGFEVAAESWIVTGESGALERAVTNLLDNAAKWSPDGSTVSVSLAGGRLVVADRGAGIAAEDLPHVFERFYRSDESRSMPGSGLGLSIVQQVAQRHGGTVAADNHESGGARLTLVLPGSRLESASV